MKLTAIVFTRWSEEENYIDKCLDSVRFADEIILIEDQAPAKTIEKAKNYTKKIYRSESNSFAARHNLGRTKAQGDWLMYVDADERISHKLAEEIQKTLDNPSFDAYQFHRVNIFLGKKVRYGDRYPDNITRLFRKDKMGDWTGIIHESSRVNGKIGLLDAPFYHLTHRNIYTMLEKTINFSEPEAQLRFDGHHPPVVWWRFPRVILTEAWHRLVTLQGWRQGTEGWIDGLFQAMSLFVVYARLWEKQRRPSLEDIYRQIDEDISSGKL